MTLKKLLLSSLTLFVVARVHAGSFEHFVLPRVVEGEPGWIAVTPTHLWVLPKERTSYIAKVGFDGQVQALMPLNSSPSVLTATPDDGNAWFAGNYDYGRITPDGSASSPPLPGGYTFFVRDITVGPDNRIWIAYQDQLLRVDRSPISATSFPFWDAQGITSGPDGNVWVSSLASISKVTTGGDVTTYGIPNDGGGQALEITAASDGKLWFTTTSGKTRGISTSGSFTAAFDGAAGRDIVAGADGRLWWYSSTVLKKWVPEAAALESTYDIGAENVGINAIAKSDDGVWWGSKGKKIGRVTYAGAVEQWPFKPYGPTPWQMVTAYGDLWYTSPGSNQIGRTTTAGATTIHELPNPNSAPRALTIGPDGALWFTELARIGRIDAAGAITEYDLPEGVNGPTGITTGPDGNLWIAAKWDDEILRMTPAGVFTAFTLTAGSLPDSIVAGPDGNLWFTETGSAKIGRSTPAGVITEFAAGAASGPIASSGGFLWYSGGNRHYRMNTAGARTELATMSSMITMAVAADGSVWGRGGGQITKVAPDGTAQSFYTGFYGNAIASGPDGAIWVANDAQQALVRVTFDTPLTGTGITACLPADRYFTGTVATFVDPDPRPVREYSARVDWGDGAVYSSTSGSVTETSPGHFSVSASGPYSTGGTKTVKVYLTVEPSATRVGGTYLTTSTLLQAALVAGTANVSSTGGSGTVQVNDAGNCGWSATKNGAWVSLPNGSSGTGSAVLPYTVQPNTTGETRYASITVGGQTLVIAQTPAGGTGLYLITPCRLYDSRDTSSQIGGGASWQLSTIATCGIAADAKALVANITVVSPALDGWLSVWKNGEAWPGVSTLNYRPGRTRANNAVIPLVDQAFMIRNGGQTPVHFIVDVTGYFK